MSKKLKQKTGGTSANSQCVCVELDCPQAREVFIAGSFNDWHPTVTPMIARGEGKWAKELTLSPGRYEYLFVVDGQWLPDPAATETTPNPYGGMNSVLTVGAPTAQRELKRKTLGGTDARA